MKIFSNKLAVITGAGSGIGRTLARQLVKEGADIAVCDVMYENLQSTLAICEAEAAQGRMITIHRCDVSDESEVMAFRDAVKRQHDTDHINLLFNNAGVGGVTSFVNGSREIWEHTFNVCWFGVYNCSRAFMPMLVASDEAHIINTSSINGFWASLGKHSEHTAYSSAKFAVKGFSEALIQDLAANAPHVKVSVVMPGHIGTSIVINSRTLLGDSEPSPKQLARVRENLRDAGIDEASMSDQDVILTMHAMAEAFRDQAPTTAERAAEIILDGVREERWRVLVGEDAHRLDEMVRESPESAYSQAFFDEILRQGQLSMLVRNQ